MTHNKVLFILHMPNPVHGAALMGKYIKESKIINKSFDGDYINLSTSQHVHEVGKAGIGKIVNLIKIQGKVLKALMSKKYDLTYLTLTAKGSGFYKDLMIVVILKLFRKKIIYHFHNKGVSARQNNTLNHLLYKLVFTHTQSILLSQYLYYDIEKYVTKEKVFFCPNGIPEMGNLNPQTLPKEKINDNLNFAPRLLFLSNMIIEKGVLVLIEACKILKDKDIKFECHFVGAWTDISEEEFSNKVLNNNLTDYIFSHGKKYNDEKLYFYNSADIFVFPTFYHNECFPLVLLEAMQFNLPIVSTNEGGIADIISDGVTGFVVPKNDAAELAKKLELLINNTDLRLKMGAAGKDRYENLFTLERFEDRLSHILKQAIRS